MKPWLQDNYIEMYSRNNDWKSVVAERFIRTLKDKFYKYMTPVSKNVYIETKPADVKSSTYIDFVIENNEKDPKLEVGDQVRISKYKNIFAKGNVPNLSEEVLWLKNFKNTVPLTYVVSDLNVAEIVGTSDEKELRVEEVIKRKDDKLMIDKKT